MINKNSPIPIYYQIEELLRKQIEEGRFIEGDSIPSERSLSKEYDVSRMTIRQAINNLVSEGILVREKGKGTFVNQEKIEIPLVKLSGFSEDMKMRGLTPSTEIMGLSVVEITKSESRETGIEEGTKCYRVCRLRLADGIPMAYEILTLPKKIFENLDINHISNSFYQYVEKDLKLKIEGAKQTLEPSIANEEESEVLQIKKASPILLLKRMSYLDDGRMFEFVKSIYRGDRYKFITEMKR